MDILTAYQVPESTSLTQLVISPVGKLLPPEGKLLTMVVNGTVVDPLPGAYSGDIQLVVTDYIDAPIEGMHSKPGDPPEPYRAALLLGKDGPEANAAAAGYVGGSVDGTTISGGTMRSTADAASAPCR